MPCSPARLASNRRNALRSTGPRTAEGKERSRSNALKHGLTGEGVAISTEDSAAVAGRFEALRDELSPQTVMGGILVKRLALLSVRLDRCARQEAAALSERVEHAGVAFDEGRMEEVQRLLALLDDDPAGAVRKLRRMPEGVDRMIAGWTSLREDLGVDDLRGWRPLHCQLAEKLAGRHPGGIGYSRIEALFRATGGDFRSIGAEEGANLDDNGRREWAVARLAEIVDAHLADLRALRPTLDLAAIARDRAGAADRALVDPSKQAVLVRKYEAAAERGMFRALKELRQVEAEGPTTADDEQIAPEPAPLGSFFRADREAEIVPAIGPRPGPIEPSRLLGSGSDGPGRVGVGP